MAIVIGNQCAEPFRKKDTISSQRMLAGRINDLVITTVTELGTRASFRIEPAGQCPVFCCVDGNIARELIAHYCDGDLVAVSGFDEPRPSTAATNTPWPGRFRVRALRAAEHVCLAAWGHAQAHDKTETILRLTRHRCETSGTDIARCPTAIPSRARSKRNNTDVQDA